MDKNELAEVVRSACLDAAEKAYEEAGIMGLCGEGRWEYAVQAVRQLDVEEVLGEKSGRETSSNASSSDS